MQKAQKLYTHRKTIAKIMHYINNIDKIMPLDNKKKDLKKQLLQPNHLPFVGGTWPT